MIELSTHLIGRDAICLISFFIFFPISSGGLESLKFSIKLERVGACATSMPLHVRHTPDALMGSGLECHAYLTSIATISPMREMPTPLLGKCAPNS
jgi:hypothetical protein